MNTEPVNKRRPLLIALLATIFLLAVLVAVGLFKFATTNPLPSDEEMMAYFNAHRGDIEELVRRYRYYEPPPGQKQGHYLWDKQGDTRELFKRAKVKYVQYVIGIWPPNPYSPETVERLKAMPEKFLDEKHFKYGTIRIKIDDWRYGRGSPRYSVTWKDLIFIPEVPRIENSRIIVPTGGGGSFEKRVLPSLNDYPPDWRRGECVCRQIDPHWFIQMCRS